MLRQKLYLLLLNCIGEPGNEDKNVQNVASPLLFAIGVKGQVPGILLSMAVILIKTYIVTFSIICKSIKLSFILEFEYVGVDRSF